jgi:hypothetical protein
MFRRYLGSHGESGFDAGRGVAELDEGYRMTALLAMGQVGVLRGNDDRGHYI